MADAVRASLDSFLPWLTWCSTSYDVDDALAHIRICEAHWAAGTQYAFAICDRSTGALVGSAGLNQLNPIHRSANAGYWIRRADQGQGLAARALMLAARFGFSTLGLVRIEIVANKDNLASRRTAERAGARFEVVARNRLWMGDHPADGAVYSLVPDDLG